MLAFLYKPKGTIAHTHLLLYTKSKCAQSYILSISVFQITLIESLLPDCNASDGYKMYHFK